jgi:lysine/ornithine N-monooxygenase
MMLLTKPLACLMSLAVLSSVAVAKTNPECLKHLGGGYGDAECYHGLSADIVASNERLYKNIRATIPANNSHSKLLDEYMKAQENIVRFCELQRDSGDKWNAKHDGSMYPAIYEQCIYDARKAQNKFLDNVLTMTKW